MIFDLRRAPRALVRSAGVVLVLAFAFTLLFPQVALSAGAPEIVSVDVTGNLHVPTATIMQVIQARPGEVYKATCSGLVRLVTLPTLRRRSFERGRAALPSPTV
jgi:hypothetical protein